jgi:hypothetical protein
MNNISCIYPDRDAVLVAYLYDDIDAVDRVAFETHVMTCLPCRGDLADLRGVRETLGSWVSPEPGRAFTLESRAPDRESRSRWHSVPVWAQVAAAMLVLGVSASIANLNIRYDHSGVNVTTGWSKAAPVVAAQPQQNDTAWHAELAALQTQLRSEMRAQAATVKAAPAPVPAAEAMSDAEFGRRVRVLLTESEKKQEQQLAVRLVQLQKDFDAQRQADIRRNNQLFRQVMSTYSDEITKQQRQINYLLPASQR